MCVQDVDVQCVLQFTLIHAAGCALHRPPSRVIHHLELSKRCQIRPVSARNKNAGRDREECFSPRAKIKTIDVRETFIPGCL